MGKGRHKWRFVLRAGEVTGDTKVADAGRRWRVQPAGTEVVSQSTARTTFAVSDRSASTTSAPASRSSLADERPLATPTERAPPIRAAATSRPESAMYTVASSANSTP